MGASKKNSTAAESGGLKRNIGLMAAVNVIISVMIGSGIFVSPTAALEHSGSIGLCLVVWTACGIISLMGALCFAELGTVIPRSGGEYAFLLESFSKLHRFWGPLPAFICSWVYVVVLRPAAIAVVILTFAKYSMEPLLPLIGLTELCADDKENIVKLVALLGLGIITYINMVSVKLYVQINNIFSFFKVFACLVVIGGGIYQLAIGKTENLSTGFQGTTTNPGAIALAFYSGLWAYDGWSSVTVITEEIKNPEVNIPRSIAIAVPVVTALYVFMNLAYMTVLTPMEMMKADAVAVVFGDRVLGPFSFIIPLGVALSTFGCAMSIQFSTTRLCFVSGREGHFLEPMSYVHVRRSTPIPAVALSGIIVFVFIVVGNISALIDFASFLIWVTYGACMTGLLILRKTQPDTPRPYRVPTIIPVFILAVSIFLSLMPIITNPSAKYLAALGFIALGMCLYTPFVYYKKRPRIMNTVTYILQMLLNVASTVPAGPYAPVATEEK